MLGTTYNHILEKGVLPLGDKLEGGDFMRWLHQYRQEQWLPGEQLRQLQQKRLNDTLTFARSQVPFYKDITASSGNPFDDIKQFPILTKIKIKENIDQFLTQPKEHLVAESGSGSSGVQGTVYLDRSAQASQRAMQMLWFEWSGYRIGDSILQTGMTLNRGFFKKTKDFLLDTSYVPAFNLDRNAVETILRKVEKTPRRYLFGYASSLYVLAQTALEAGIRNVKFDYAVSWGDKLFTHYRQKIKQAFGCETLDTYGCSEGAMIAGECRQRQFHLSVNQCYIEIVDDDGQPVRAGQMGKVLATRFDNFAMPLIRYYIGDLVELDAEEGAACACGRQLPRLRRVIGRDTDIVKTATGKQLIVHFFTAIFEHIPGISQFKVVQKNLNEMEIHYIPNSDFRYETLLITEKKIHSHLQEKFPIKWIATRRIAPTKSGKPQIIQSFLKQSLTHQSAGANVSDVFG